jgi:polyisoprenoid-binding protein YceI
MKTMRSRSTIGFGFVIYALTLLVSYSAETVNSGKLALAPESKLWLEGDSTLHAYESEATVLNLESKVVTDPDAKTEIKAAVVENGEQDFRLSKLLLTIPVEEMESGVVGLAGRLHKTLKSKDHPNIVFKLKAYNVKEDPEKEGQYKITAEGDLTLAGVTKEVQLVMTALRKDDYIEVKGERDLLMTDFDVKPPSLMFGAIKTADEVVVKWDLRVVVKSEERSEKDNEITLSKAGN